eukprot:5405826-Pyramimonas_sp.AAC.1
MHGAGRGRVGGPDGAGARAGRQGSGVREARLHPPSRRQQQVFGHRRHRRHRGRSLLHRLEGTWPPSARVPLCSARVPSHLASVPRSGPADASLSCRYLPTASSRGGVRTRRAAPRLYQDCTETVPGLCRDCTRTVLRLYRCAGADRGGPAAGAAAARLVPRRREPRGAGRHEAQLSDVRGRGRSAVPAHCGRGGPHAPRGQAARGGCCQRERTRSYAMVPFL